MNPAQLHVAANVAEIQALQGCRVSAAYLHLYALHKAQNPTPPEEPPFVPCFPLEVGLFDANDDETSLLDVAKQRLEEELGLGAI